MSEEEKGTIEIFQDVGAKETGENVEMIETDRLLDETVEFDSKAFEEVQGTIAAESDANVSNTKTPEKYEKIETDFRALAFGSVTTIKSTRRKHIVNARTVLWYLSFVGFAINYMLRVNINIAITEMVTSNASKHISYASECIVDGFANRTATIVSRNLTSSIIDAIPPPSISYTIEQRILDYFGLYFSPTGNHWNEVQTNQVLGAYYWLHWVAQIPGGLLAKRYGTKLVFGGANFVVSVLSFVVPFATFWDIRALIALRIIQGFIAAVQWPSMHNLAAQWIPPDERSTFVASYLGSSVGVAVFSPLFGYILSAWSWQYIFYVSGMIGVVWYLAWLYYVYDTPAEHPRIDPFERQYIEKSLEGIVHHNRKGSVPWKDILLSGPIWTNFISHWACAWGNFTLMTQTPTYFRVIHGWNMQWIGWLTGFPHLLRMIFALLFSKWADSALRRNKMSRRNVRKLASALCTIFSGLCLFAMAFSGCNAWIAVFSVTIAIMISGAVSTGPFANVIDISPNYSGIILGLTGTVAVFPGFISPYIVGRLTLNNQTVQQWQYVFLISTVCMVLCGVHYVIFGQAELQSWNQPKEKKVAYAVKVSKNGAQIKA